MEKATQFVHGTPRLAASHRTCYTNILASRQRSHSTASRCRPNTHLPRMARLCITVRSNRLAPSLTSEVPRQMQARGSWVSTGVARVDKRADPRSGTAGSSGTTPRGREEDSQQGRRYRCQKQPQRQTHLTCPRCPLSEPCLDVRTLAASHDDEAGRGREAWRVHAASPWYLTF